MGDTYEAIYNAVRSRIGEVDGRALMDQIVQKFDVSHAVEILKHEGLNIAYEMQRPSVVFKPKISSDGDKWCVLYGENLQDGVCGFGDSPDEAMRDFDKHWSEKLKEKQ